MFVLLFLVLSVFFCPSYVPGYVQFSNDGPYGRLASACHHLPDRFAGDWEDLNSIGFRGQGAPPTISFGLQYLLHPEGFSKFQALSALLILGLSAWCFFKQSGLAPAACLLGGLAAALNACFFSNACWGISAHPITIGMCFLAMAALLDTNSKRRWLLVPLAGFAVGMGVSEGDDVGALFSTLVAAFVLWRAIIADGARAKNITVGVVKVGVVVVCAIWLAAAGVAELVVTNIKGVHGAQQDQQTKEQRWDWATQWSMPKPEVLGFIAPGLFGYRMASPEGGAYWGAVGRDAGWQKYFDSGNQGDPPKKGFKRYSGGGYYAGMLVVLVAIWAALQALRRKDSVFSPIQRKTLWFWIALGAVSVLFAFGRWAPFYRLLYALPYFSTMRNPVKFIDFVSCALVVLFAFGIDGLWRKYMVQAGVAGNGARPSSQKAWWSQASKFEKGWVRGCGVALGVSLLGWLIYAGCREKLETYLVRVQFEPSVAHEVAGFSIQQVGWFILFFTAAAALVLWILKGSFAGRQARMGIFALGLLLVVDLGRANLPWIVYWELDDKYLTNPIIESLRDKPYEHRVAIVPMSPSGQNGARNNTFVSQLYRVEWLQHELPYFNVQCLDNVQMPRKSEALFDYEKDFQPTNQDQTVPLITRRWELTNTRYLFGVVGIESYINYHLAGTGKELRILQRFRLTPKPGTTGSLRIENMTAAPDPEGALALFEFSGALPRVKLYSNWLVTTNDQKALSLLVDRNFNPERTVLVSDPIPDAVASATNDNPGATEIVSYAPKHLVIKADARVPSVLLLNDRHDPDWNVQVDGRSAPLLRCNYLVRGVSLTPGEHTVDFSFHPTYKLGNMSLSAVDFLYVSLSAVVVALGLLGFVLWAPRDDTTAPAQEATAQTEARTPQAAQPRQRAEQPGKGGRKLASGARR
jgi:hypothetical protein